MDVFYTGVYADVTNNFEFGRSGRYFLATKLFFIVSLHDSLHFWMSNIPQ